MWPYSWALRQQSLSIWNRSFSLAVLSLHIFISILIFMYLEKCSFFFFSFFFFFFFFFFRKKYWHTENNFLGFYNSHVILSSV